jgi:hypothetical protein
VLNGFWLGDRLSSQQVDVLAFWLPRWSFLGDALRAGHVPAWLPNQFAGVPFASDPQSGWLYLPAMLLFTMLPAARAMEWFIVSQPIIAGLGLWWFLRHEGLGRPASTFGGLTFALVISGSSAVLSMPFAGTLAWTAMTLAGASALVRARRPLPIAGWLAFTAFAWTQIAAAHLTDGLLIGTAVTGVYLIARTLEQIRHRERTVASAAILAAILIPALVVLSAGAWLPRIDLIPRTSIGLGYRTLGALTNRLSSGPYAQPPLATHGLGPWWPTAFARGLGGYLGAVAVLLVPVAFASRRFRWPAIGFAALAAVGWMLNLDRLIAAIHVRRLALSLGIGELWLRDPSRFRYLVMIAFTILAAYGLQAWLDMGTVDRGGALRRLWWLAPGFVLFVVGPLIAGAPFGRYAAFACGAAVGIPLLYLAARGRARAAPLLVAVVALELTTAAIVGQFGPPPVARAQGLTLVYDTGLGSAFAPLHAPNVDPGAYLTPGRIGKALIADRGSDLRYLSFDERIAKRSSRGFLSHQTPQLWPAYENGRSIVFGLDEIQGYSPIQLDRYWRLVRASNTVPIFFNSATFQSANPAVLRLFGVGWVIAPTKQGPPGPLPPDLLAACRVGYHACIEVQPLEVAREGNFTLWRLPWAQPRASLVFDVRSTTPAKSLRAVLDPSFDPGRTVLLEGPSPRLAPASGSASYRQLDAEHALVRTSASAPGWLVVRNPYDRNWHATIDGRPARIRIADYMMQGIAVPAGSHVVALTYRDPAIRTGLAISVVGWAALLLVIAWLRRGERSPQDEIAEPAAGGEGDDEPLAATTT